ncbi:MAG: hypothetical protein L7S44_08010 [Flavobacteriaceae bacterium]|jgi:hypothetical protein|nr:hypothetical protein [Flavobacteriaceae bacterium]
MNKKFYILFILLFTIDISFGQCAMCRAVLESEEGQTSAKGINDGIMYLMAIPYLVVASLAFVLYKKFKK